MKNRAGHPLTVWKKLILATTGVMALAAPVAMGVLSAPPLGARSQATVADRPAFEVASVKPNTSRGPSNLNFAAGGRFTARNMPLRALIRVAFRLQDFQLSGGPDLLDDRFDIVAKAEGNLPVNELQLRLRTLLGDRFGLTVHRETRELPVYTLVMARSDGRMGAQLRHSGVDCAPITVPAGVGAPPPPPPPVSPAPAGPGADADPNRVGQGCGGMLIPGRLSGRMMTMTQVANTLSRFLNRMVIERTGLTGNFDLDLVYTPDQMPLSGPQGLPLPAGLAPSSEDPSIFTAVQEQLGLKLHPTKGPVQVLVIDHVQRPSDDQAASGLVAAPTFEVASVKPNTSHDGERNGNVAGGRFTLTYATLRELVQFAYQRPDGQLRDDSQISGGPGWTNSDHFDIVAMASGMPSGVDASDTAAGAATSAELAGIDRVRLMLRTLLADRFKLTVHNELRELPIYALVLDRNDGKVGPRLHAVDVDCAMLRDGGRRLPAPGPDQGPCGGFIGLGPGHNSGHAVPMSMIAALLEGPVSRTVFDRTGLAGKFDIDLQWTSDQPRWPGAPELSPGSLNGPSIFTAVREQLGLKLESTKGPVDVLVIDHAEPPTSN